MKQQKEVVAVLSKEDRDPFKYFQPPWWKQPFYTIEDAFESFLQSTQAVVNKARTSRVPKGLSPLGLSYAFFAALALVFVALFVNAKMTFF